MNYSVIIPAYNAARTITRAVESVRAQTSPPEAIIVVDDGSSDRTSEVVASLSAVKLVQQKNRGPGAARNRGVGECRSEWLAFLDADDTWLPHKMERQLSLVSEPGVGVIHCSGPEARRPAPPTVTFDDLWKSNCITLSSAVVRRSAFDQVGAFSEEPSLTSVEDYNLWLRIAAAGWRILTWPETLIHYTPAPDSLSSNEVRFARANLVNARLIGELLKLEPAAVERQIHAIYVSFGKNLFWRRELGESRRFLAAAIRRRPSADLLLTFMATFVPRWILDGRRRLSCGQN
jgi:glycosyltransferase involved in cell wall biosynthesis